MAGVASDQTGHILHNLLLFGHLLRRLGLNVHEGRMLDTIRVLEDIGMTRRVDVWSALRTLLVQRKDDLPIFDEAFEVFWRQRKGPYVIAGSALYGRTATLPTSGGRPSTAGTVYGRI